MPVLIDFISTLPEKTRSTPEYHQFHAIMHDQLIESVREKTKAAIKDGLAVRMDLAQICRSVQNSLQHQFTNVSCAYLSKAVTDTAHAAKLTKVKANIIEEFNQLTSPMVMEVISEYYQEQLEVSRKKSPIAEDGAPLRSDPSKQISVSSSFFSAQKSIGLLLARNQAYKPSPIPFKATFLLKKEASATRRFVDMLEQYPPLKMEKSSARHVDVSIEATTSQSSKNSSSEHSISSSSSSASYGSSSARSSYSSTSSDELSMVLGHKRIHSYDSEIKAHLKTHHQKKGSLGILNSQASSAESGKDDIKGMWIKLVNKVQTSSRFFKKKALNSVSTEVERFLNEADSIIKSAEELLSPAVKQLEKVGKTLCDNFPQKEAEVHSFFTKNELLLSNVEDIGKNRNVVIRKAIEDAESIFGILLEIDVEADRKKLKDAVKQWKELLKKQPYLVFNTSLVSLKNELKQSLALMPPKVPCKERDQFNQLELFILKMGERCQRIQGISSDFNSFDFFKMEISEVQNRNINREHGKGSKVLRDEIALIETQIQALRKQWSITIASSSFFSLKEAFIDWTIIDHLGAIQKSSEFIAFENYLKKRSLSSREQYDELEYIRYWQWHYYLERYETPELDELWDNKLKEFAESDPEACRQYEACLNRSAQAPQSVKYIDEFHKIKDKEVLKEFTAFRNTFFKRDYNKLEQLCAKSEQLQRTLEKTKISEPEPSTYSLL